MATRNDGLNVPAENLANGVSKSASATENCALVRSSIIRVLFHPAASSAPSTRSRMAISPFSGWSWTLE